MKALITGVDGFVGKYLSEYIFFRIKNTVIYY